jgi:hypothetical protein
MVDDFRNRAGLLLMVEECVEPTSRLAIERFGHDIVDRDAHLPAILFGLTGTYQQNARFKRFFSHTLIALISLPCLRQLIRKVPLLVGSVVISCTRVYIMPAFMRAAMSTAIVSTVPARLGRIPSKADDGEGDHEGKSNVFHVPPCLTGLLASGRVKVVRAPA